MFLFKTNADMFWPICGELDLSVSPKVSLYEGINDAIVIVNW